VGFSLRWDEGKVGIALGEGVVEGVGGMGGVGSAWFLHKVVLAMYLYILFL